MTARVLFFGCWNEAGHHLVQPGGRQVTWLSAEERYRLSRELDGAFAPQRTRNGRIFCAHGASAQECPQGQFARHQHAGYSLIAWWDRCQGDTRFNSSSTVLLEGEHTSEELLAALAEHFPSVLENLRRNGVELVEVKLA